MRVVCGAPVLWDRYIAATTPSFEIGQVVWSPCNRFIAIFPDSGEKLYILDSTTLQKLEHLKFSKVGTHLYLMTLAFSPGGCLISSAFYCTILNMWFIVSWDLQTGGVVSSIVWKDPNYPRKTQITYSMDGKMIAALFQYSSAIVISIYDIFSGVQMSEVHHHTYRDSDSISETSYVYNIWTHKKSLQFATYGKTAITIWETEFTQETTPTRVKSVSIPGEAVITSDSMPTIEYIVAQTKFHPASCRLAFIRSSSSTLLIWDTLTSKFLLQHPNVDYAASITFSLDGHLFACRANRFEIFLWKESPTGYTLFAKIAPRDSYSKPLLSPNGELVVTFSTLRGESTIQLWHTKGLIPSPSILAQASQRDKDFVLEFFPDRPLVAAAWKRDNMVMVLNLQSGLPQLTIDTSMEIYGLRPIKNTIVVIGHTKIVTWDLSKGNFLPDARMNVEDSTQTIESEYAHTNDIIFSASISFDSKYVACDLVNGDVLVYCTSTWQKIDGNINTIAFCMPPGGHDIYCYAGNNVEVYTITQNAVHYTKTVSDIDSGPWGCPWGSSCGYKVTNEGWILGQDGKKLLMLPPLWQAKFEYQRVWNEKFLALLHGGLHELVILELEP